MKNILLLLFSAFSITAQSQTAIIAHKSHSGMAATFFTDPSSNFGEPPPRLEQVVRLNDTTSIEVYNDMGYYYYDTVYNNRLYANYKLDIDSIQRKNPYFPVDYINFKKSPDSLKMKEQGVTQMRVEQTVNPQTPAKPEKKIHSTKKKKSKAILFVLLFLGGGLLSVKLLNRKSVVPIPS